MIMYKFQPCSHVETQTIHTKTHDHYSYRRQSVVTMVQPYLTSVLCLFLLNSFLCFLFSAMDTQSNFSALQKKNQGHVRAPQGQYNYTVMSQRAYLFLKKRVRSGGQDIMLAFLM